MDKEEISIKDIVELHRSVSENIKMYETLTNEYMPIEVSNELRYAFRAIIDYLDDAKQDKTYDLVRAHYALRCAYFDLTDGLVVTVYEYITSLLIKYPLETTQIINNAIHINEYVHNLNEKISKSRGGSQKEKLLIYDELHKDELNELSSHYKQLKLSYPIIKKMYIEKQSKNNKSYLIGIFGIAVGIFSVIVSIIIN